MTMARGRAIGLVAGAALLATAGPALADVKAGVDAWSRGDWKTAVAEWQGPAQNNDPDALFDLAQAYRLGHGVPQDERKARDYYGRAAKLGHVRAAEIYGIMLFQDGERAEAMPYIEDAAKRGNPSAEYLLGIQLFNGELVQKDWVRAYALLTLANAQQLRQAKAALAQMDQFIPLEQRQQAAQLATQLQQDADATRARELAAVDLAVGGDAETPSAPPAPTPQFTGSPRVPQPIHSVDVEPSVEAAQDAVRQAMLATGTESPAEAGADYARPAASAPRAQVASSPPRPAPEEHKPAPPPVIQARTSAQPATAASGPWKLQLGVFSVWGNAERLWSDVQGRPELAGKNRLLIPVGRLTKLLVGGYVSEGEASAACQRLKAAGHDCLVTK